MEKELSDVSKETSSSKIDSESPGKTSLEVSTPTRPKLNIFGSGHDKVTEKFTERGGSLDIPDRPSMSDRIGGLLSPRRKGLHHVKTLSTEFGEVVTEAIPKGVAIVSTLLEESKQLILPGLRPKPPKPTKKSVYFASMGKDNINSSFILLLIVITRIGAALMTGDRIVRMYGGEISHHTGWTIEELTYYLSLVYWLSGIATLILSLIIGIFLFFVIPYIETAAKRSTITNHRILNFVDFVMIQIKYPTIGFVSALVITCASILGLNFALLTNKSPWMVILFRSIFGIFDTISKGRVPDA